MRVARTTALFAAALLAGCASLTPYQPRTDGYGYAEQILEQNRVRVSFAGSTATPRETVEQYLLYRAAELTLERGFDHFVLSRTLTEARAGAGAEPTVSLGFSGFSFGSRSGFGLGVGTTTGGGPKTAYTAQADVLMQRGSKPVDGLQAFNAREVRSNLEAQIRRPATR